MTWVKSRRWDDHGRRWTVGKIHWMERPWITTCGLEVTDDWTEGHPMPHRAWPGLCKKCGGDT